MSLRAAEVSGFVSEGFEAVADAFRENFDQRHDLGAAFAAVVDGRPVIDLWGGIADAESGRPWRADTLQLVFSGTKGFVAICLLMLIERGQLDLDAPVARYWPEFAAAGKEGVLVRHVVSHQAGLPAIDVRVGLDEIPDDVLMAGLLAEKEPVWGAGEAICYHGLTYGWLCGELVRRVDGRSVGRFFAEEIAAPLGLELWIGLAEELEPRVTTLRRVPGEPLRFRPDVPPELRRALNRPEIWEEPLPWNTRAYHAAEIPGAGAIGTARAIARLYGCLARGGELDGVRLLFPETIELGRATLARGEDAAYGDESHFGVGFQLQTDFRTLGPPDDAFGHGGAGGSVHGAWRTERVGFSYAMNEMRDAGERSEALLSALHRALTRVS